MFTPDILAEIETQTQEAEDRVRERKPLASEEEIRAEAGEQIFECLPRQRRYLQGAVQRAKNTVLAMGYYPNHNDYLTNLEMAYVGEAAMALCCVTDPYGSPLATTVTDLAKRCVEAEAGNSSKDKLIDALRDDIHDLQLQLGRALGSRK